MNICEPDISWINEYVLLVFANPSKNNNQPIERRSSKIKNCDVRDMYIYSSIPDILYSI